MLCSNLLKTCANFVQCISHRLLQIDSYTFRRIDFQGIALLCSICWSKNSTHSSSGNLMKGFFVNIKMVFLKTSFQASKMKDLEQINSGYLSNQYSTAFHPNPCHILVYNLATSNDTCFEFFDKFILYFFKAFKIIFYITFNLVQEGLQENIDEITKTFSQTFVTYYYRAYF